MQSRLLKPVKIYVNVNLNLILVALGFNPGYLIAGSDMVIFKIQFVLWMILIACGIMNDFSSNLLISWQRVVKINPKIAMLYLQINHTSMQQLLFLCSTSHLSHLSCKKWLGRGVGHVSYRLGLRIGGNREHCANACF